MCSLLTDDVEPIRPDLLPGKGWHNLAQLKLATLEYVDWFNHRRLHEAYGYRPPAEYEALCYAASTTIM